MSGLQEAFYIVGIVYMGISLLLIFGLVIAVGVIRSARKNYQRQNRFRNFPAR
jgi:hypothetical protein